MLSVSADAHRAEVWPHTGCTAVACALKESVFSKPAFDAGLIDVQLLLQSFLNMDQAAVHTGLSKAC